MYPHYSGIHLRKVEKKDLNDLFDLKCESWWGTHNSPIINSEDQLSWFESMPKDGLVMIAECEGFPVGVAIYSNINWISRNLGISGSIYQNHRSSKEIVKNAFSAGLDFAFEMLNMIRVEAEVLEYNIPAQQLEINHLGFVVEGKKRMAVYKSGQYYDSIMLGITRIEWAESERVRTRLACPEASCNNNVNHSLMKKMSDRFNRGNHTPSCS